MIEKNIFIEIEAYQIIKSGEAVSGDNYKIDIDENTNRYISVLSDGLGSGIKASLLSNMTTSMAVKFVKENVDILKFSEIIMDSLPICEIRKISYSTFTILDILDNEVKIIEMDNPDYIHIRDFQEITHKKNTLISSKWPDRKIFISDFELKLEDRILFFSDGVSQAGLGHNPYKFGWKTQGCRNFAIDVIKKNKNISARDLSRIIAKKALSLNPNNKAVDDVSCIVVYCREPRKLRLLTGPPVKIENDIKFLEYLKNFNGSKIICGGTTSQIIARLLNKKIETNFNFGNYKLPPTSKIEGFDLVTEGILTLTEVAIHLEKNYEKCDEISGNIINLFMENDIIEFIVGTKINEAHQDPNLPKDLDMRRNIIKRIKFCLETKYRKKVLIKYI
jgi:hypothetical protein